MKGLKESFTIQDSKEGEASGALLVSNGTTIHGGVYRPGMYVVIGVARHDGVAIGNVLRYPTVMDHGATAEEVEDVGKYLLLVAERMKGKH